MDDLVKMLGSGAVGVISGWTGHWGLERSKLRKMQRHLYRELADNYGTLWEALNLDRPMTSYASRGHLPYRLQFEYFDHAQKDLDTLRDVKGFPQITDLYLMLKALDTKLKAGFSIEHVGQMASFCHAVEEAAEMGLFDKRALLKHCPDWLRPTLKDRIKERAKEVEDLPIPF